MRGVKVLVEGVLTSVWRFVGLAAYPTTRFLPWEQGHSARRSVQTLPWSGCSTW